MNAIPSQYHFHGVSLTPVMSDSGIWLTSADVAKALGYKSTKSISNLFAQYEDEFSREMTLVIESMTNGINGSSRRMKVRVFSLRGAHLIAMFARTPVAKAFRHWVLDILDNEARCSPVVQQFTDEELVSLSYLWFWFEKSRMASKTIYPALVTLGSPLAGRFGDIAKEARYTADQCRAMLARESGRITSDSPIVRHAAEVLATLRGESDSLLRH